MILTFQKNNITIFDTNSDGLLEFINADLIKILPRTGEVKIFNGAESLTITQAPTKKLLAKRSNVLGGHIDISYKLHNGFVLTDTVTTVAAKNSKQKITYLYSADKNGYNPLTGVFEGFSKVTKIFDNFDSRMQNHRQTNEYYIDAYKNINLLQLRSKLVGKLKTQSLFQKVSIVNL